MKEATPFFREKSPRKPGTKRSVSAPTLSLILAVSVLACYRCFSTRLLDHLTYATISSSSSPQKTISQRQSATDETPSWHKYIRFPSGDRRAIPPVAVVANSTVGSVRNPNGLLAGASASGPTVLSRLTDSDPVPCLSVDFGQNYAGVLSLDFAGGAGVSGELGKPGITLAFSETLAFLTNKSDFTRSDNAPDGSADKVVLDGTDQIAVPPRRSTWTAQQGCTHPSVCSDGLHGFRYLKICLADSSASRPYTTPHGQVNITSLHLDLSGYAGTPETFSGWFECSDEQLTQWWYDGVYTNDLTTDVFLANTTEPRQAASETLEGKWVLMDGAKRDRDPYVGDVAVSALTGYLSHGEKAEEWARNVLEDLILHQREDGWIPPASIRNYTLPLFDYPLWWVKCLHDLVMYTGNKTFATQYYDHLAKLLNTFYPNSTDQTTDLLSKSSDWGDFAFLPRSSVVTYYNALYVLALNQAADLALRLSNDTARSSEWRARAETVSANLVKRNWDESAGAFYDGSPCPHGTTDTICKTHSQDGNSLSVLAGILTSSNATRALDFLSNHTARAWGNAFFDNNQLQKDSAAGSAFDQRVYAFLSFFEISARFETQGSEASGYEQLRRMYGWMAGHDPGVTMWEGIGNEGQPYEGGFTSMAHGWSTGVVTVLTNYVLGAKPKAPGWSEWEIRPVLRGGGVTWARGEVPIGSGGVMSLSWNSSESSGNSEVFRLQVTALSGTNGTVSVPVGEEVSIKAGDGWTVQVNGQQVYRMAAGAQQGSASVDAHAVYANGYVSVVVQGGDTVVVSVSKGS